ncbi:MAG: glutathione peroxidase [bacterium]
MTGTALDFTLPDLNGAPVALTAYTGKVLLIVNVASKCGFTPQYTELEALYRQYQGQGLVVLGFPANNFLWQEPGDNAAIKQFCTLRYHVTFPVFAKVSVKGKDITPLYEYLTRQDTTPEGPGKITWNFNKFLVDRHGQARYRFGTRTTPAAPEVVAALEPLLAEDITHHAFPFPAFSFARLDS